MTRRLRGYLPELPRRQWKALLLVSTATFFDQYDLALFSLALKQIQAELLIPEDQLGNLGAIVRLGALPAVFLALAADRLGRRPILLGTIGAYTILTGLTAFAPDARTFIALQFLARIFAVAEVILANIVVAEEIAPEYRGWAIGLLGSLAALGTGSAYLLFGAIEYLPLGWRSLYLVGLIPLLFLSVLRRLLDETGRFEDLRRTAARFDRRQDGSPVPLGERLLAPLRHLWAGYRLRLGALGAVIFLVHFADAPAHFFSPKYLQEDHGWRPYHVTLLAMAGGGLVIFVNVLGGWLGDRRGRRPVLLFFALAYTAAGIAFYNGQSFLLLGALSVCATFSIAVTLTNLNVYSTELFATAHRSTASGLVGAVGTLGGIVGLAGESALYRLFGSHATAISLLLLAMLPALLLFRFFFPETSRRTLEDISPP